MDIGQRHREDFTTDYAQRTYGPGEVDQASFGPAEYGRQRTIPIQTVPKGALLFHYFHIPARVAGEDDNTYSRRILSVIFGRFGIRLDWNPVSQEWTICFGTETINKNQYYFPNPSAGFGINGWGDSFNAALLCFTKETTRWAYLKSGANLDSRTSIHRRQPLMTYSNFDKARVKTCDRIRFDRSCHAAAGNNYDTCLTPEFMGEKFVDGMIAIAEMDDLLDMNAIGTNTNKPMLQSMQRFYAKIQQHGNQPVDQALWAMNLLCLQTDIKQFIDQANPEPKLNVGFTEFATTPFGNRTTDPSTIPPAVLPPARFGAIGGNYRVVSEQTRHGDLVQRTFAIRDAILDRFLRDYVIRNLIIQPFDLITAAGRSFGLDNVLTAFNRGELPRLFIGPAIDRPEQQYQLNHNIGLSLADQPLCFDLRLNMFFSLDPAISELNTPLDITFRNTQNIDHTGFPLSQHAIPFSLAELNNLQELKLAHELISNRKWIGRWMYVYLYKATSGASYDVPVGPYYTPLSYIPSAIGNHLANLTRILQALETFGGAHSHTYRMLHTPEFLQYIHEWINRSSENHTQPNPFNPAEQIPYVKGYWFPELYAAGRNPQPVVHRGGTRRRSRRNNTTMRNTLKKSIKNSTTSKLGSIVSMDGGHAAPLIDDLTEDQARGLFLTQKSPVLSDVFGSLFVKPSGKSYTLEHVSLDGSAASSRTGPRQSPQEGTAYTRRYHRASLREPSAVQSRPLDSAAPHLAVPSTGSRPQVVVGGRAATARKQRRER